MNGSEVQLSQAALRPDVVSAAWSTPVLLLLALLGVSAWVAAHVLSRRLNAAWWTQAPLLLGRMAIGSCALWLICSLASRISNFEFASRWSLWTICLISAICVEAMLALYRLERRIVSRKVGIALFSLRTALVLLLGLMLAQPVLAEIFTRIEARIIAILVDDSASMDVVDTQLTASEKLQRLAVIDPSLASRSYQWESSVAALSPLGIELETLRGALASLPTAKQEAAPLQLRQRQSDLAAFVPRVDSALNDSSKLVQTLLSGDLKLSASTKDSLKRMQGRLDGEARPALEAVKELLRTEAFRLDGDAATLARLDHMLAELQLKLQSVAEELASAGAEVDSDFVASLPDYVRKQLDSAVAQSRGAVAKALLLGADDHSKGLIHKISKDYEVLIYRFADNAAPIDAASWNSSNLLTAVAHTTDSPSNAVAISVADEELSRRRAAARLSTNIGAALRTVAAELPAKSLGGVVLVGDGRQVGGDPPEAVVRQLAAEGATVSAVAIGGQRSPIDVAVVDIQGPRSVVAEDRVDIRAKVRAAGLRGQRVRVQLHEAPSASNASSAQADATAEQGGDSPLLGPPIAEQIIDVADDPFEAEALLSATPQEQRLYHYHVTATPLDSQTALQDVVPENNHRSAFVSVTDERINVLLIEERPRYEYRYLRNLMAGRDKTVRLQTVLLAPDEVAELPSQPAVPASIGRPAAQTEATRLPENETEWMKFDLVILGDVSPDRLGSAGIATLRRFVERRGGALIAIAGPNFMPHAYPTTELADVLPVMVDRAEHPLLHSPEPSFTIALTAAGRDDPITRQAGSAEENAEYWQSLPPLYWRHPVRDVKPGAKVLAFAQSEKLAEEFRRAEEAPDATLESLRELRQQQERQHALIVTQNVGSGRVLMLNTDRTWRLRYRVGDARHHRLWGQMLRWAQSDKLQAGSTLVRLGADRTAYGADEPIVVKARLVDDAYAPLIDEEAAVRVYQNDQLLLTKQLQPLADSGGRYETTLDSLPGDGGEYRLELVSPLAQPYIEQEGLERVEAFVHVQSRYDSARELADLTTDRPALRKLAHDGNGRFAEVHQADELIAAFRRPVQEQVKQQRYRIWDSWPLMLLMVGVVTAEWTLRKKAGLA